MNTGRQNYNGQGSPDASVGDGKRHNDTTRPVVSPIEEIKYWLRIMIRMADPSPWKD